MQQTTETPIAHVEWLQKNDKGITAVITFESQVTPEQVEQYKKALGRITSFIEPDGLAVLSNKETNK